MLKRRTLTIACVSDIDVSLFLNSFLNSTCHPLIDTQKSLSTIHVGHKTWVACYANKLKTDPYGVVRLMRSAFSHLLSQRHHFFVLLLYLLCQLSRFFILRKEIMNVF